MPPLRCAAARGRNGTAGGLSTFMKKCPNCGYERQPDDDRHGIIPASECPKCRVIYEKFSEKPAAKKDAPPQKHDSLIEKHRFATGRSTRVIINYAVASCIVLVVIYLLLFPGSNKTKTIAPPRETSQPANAPLPLPNVIQGQAAPPESGKLDDRSPPNFSFQSQRPNEQQSIADLYKKIAPAVVLIQTDKGSTKGLGSGFFISHGDVITNHHVMAGSSQARIKTARGETYFVTGIVAEDRANDLAMVSVSIPSDVPVRPLPVLSGPPQVGEKIVVIGNPNGLEWTVSDGIVSAIRGDKLIQITAPISRGSSGGPVINMNGEVVCVVKGIRTDVDPRAGNIAQNLNFCIPGEKIAGLRPGFNQSLDRMEATRKVYCYAEDNGTVVITDTPRKVTSYTLISRPDGTLDRTEYEKWVLKEMNIPRNPESFDPVAAAQSSIDKDKDELFRRAFPHKSSNAGMTLDEQQFWHNSINQLHKERYNRAVAWKNQAVLRYRYMMGVFDRYSASH